MVNLASVEEELRYADEEYILWVETSQERRWRNFIGHLEKSFTDLLELTQNTIYEKDAKAALKVKQSDELLIYIRESRNNIHHTANKITSYEPSGKKVTSPSFELLEYTIVGENGTEHKKKVNNDNLIELISVLPTIKAKKNVKGKWVNYTVYPPKKTFRDTVDKSKIPSRSSAKRLHFLLFPI